MCPTQFTERFPSQKTSDLYVIYQITFTYSLAANTWSSTNTLPIFQSVISRQRGAVSFKFVILHGSTVPSGPGLPNCWGYTITLRHARLDNAPLDEWWAHRRDLCMKTQHSQPTDFHAPDGIRTHNPGKRAAADPRLGPRGHWDRQSLNIYVKH